jgi:hypothetical protein
VLLLLGLGFRVEPAEALLGEDNKEDDENRSTPRANRLRSRTCAPCATPRRSRRIAGMELDTPAGGASTRTKKKVMRALDLIGETAGIDQHKFRRVQQVFHRIGEAP